jgi:hypothetical protein
MEKSGADVVYCVGNEWIDSSTPDYMAHVDKYEVYDGEAACHKLILDDSIAVGTVQTKFYKRKLFDEVRFPEGKLHEDEFVTYRLLYIGNLATMNVAVYHYQSQRPGSICNSPITLKRLDALEGIQGRMLFFKEKHNVSLFNEARVAYCKGILDWCHNILEADIPTKHSVVKDLLKEYRKQMRDVIFSPSTKIRSKGGTVVRYFTFLRKHAGLMK